MDNARGAWDLSRVRAGKFAVRFAKAVALLLTFSHRLSVALVLMLLTTTQRAAADATETRDTRARAEAILRQAEHEDDALDFAHALGHYDEGRALDPGSGRAPRAEARAAMLRAHAEGEFVPYAKLERVRRDPSLSSDPRVVDDLVREAESFPAGLVRVEVWVMAAEAYANRFARPLDADALLHRVVADPLTDRVVAQKAARDLVVLRLGRRDLGGAEEAVAAAGSRSDPQLARDVRRAVRRRSVHIASSVILLAMALLAGRAAVVAVRRGQGARLRDAIARTWKLALAYAAYVALGGALLASGYEAGTTKPFLYFGLVLVPIVLVARAWAAAGSPSTRARGARAALCAMSAAAASFLVLEGVDVTFLEGMGL
ncbi:MAG: hypothetical protein QOI41_4558 [Myxococcales bacterium]|nr:hypothetical protein [Myxococcales bacterium]